MLTKFFFWPLFDDEPHTFRHVSALYLLMFAIVSQPRALEGVMLVFTSHLFPHQCNSLLSDRVCSLDYFYFTSEDPPRRHCMRIVRGFGHQIILCTRSIEKCQQSPIYIR